MTTTIDAVIMMIVHPNENNALDQRWLEYLLWEKYVNLLNTYPF